MGGELFKDKYRIESARLHGFDYSSDGYYFVTICTNDRIEYFGKIVNQKMILSEIGKIAKQYWMDITNHFPFVVLDEFVIMSNHVHGIIIINKSVETQNFASQMSHKTSMPNAINETQNFASLPIRGRIWTPNKFGPQSQNLASIIRGFKIGVTKYATMHNIPFNWQPRFYDRIIHDERALHGIRHYIKINPLKWEFDRNNKQGLWY
ncbi:transposase [Patescibacteria group bacterium]|nr:transposase [Patescibacteria group bacterium]